MAAVMANQARVAVVVEGEEEAKLDTALASVASAVVVTVTRREVRVREASRAGPGCRLEAGRAGLQLVNTELLPWLYTARPGLVLVRLLDTLDTEMREVVEYCLHQLRALARGRMVLIGTGVEALVRINK